jgi:hypothetical protein
MKDTVVPSVELVVATYIGVMALLFFIDFRLVEVGSSTAFSSDGKSKLSPIFLINLYSEVRAS